MDLRALRGVRFPALSLTSIASMLAPTGLGHHHGCDRYADGPINPVNVHNQFNEVLLKIVRRNICSIPTHYTRSTRS